MYEFFKTLLSTSVSSFEGGVDSFLVDHIGDERLLEIYKEYIKLMCLECGDDFLDETLLSRESLETAVQSFFDQSVEFGGVLSETSFFLLLPIKINSADSKTPPRLTLCLVDDSGLKVLAGESKFTDLMFLVPNQFKHHAYGLNLQMKESGRENTFEENLLIQLNYYRKLFNLDPIA